jgi:hypothetical protein
VRIAHTIRSLTPRQTIELGLLIDQQRAKNRAAKPKRTKRGGQRFYGLSLERLTKRWLRETAKSRGRVKARAARKLRQRARRVAA